MHDYQWDVFISYRQFDKWKEWIDKHFKPFLKKALQVELRKTDVRIFVDRDDIVEGANWPDNLRSALATSRVLVPLICAGYWDTEWCRRELAIMLEREGTCGHRAKNSVSTLIIPILIHDGDRIPPSFSKVQVFKAKPAHVRSHLSSKAGLETFIQEVAVRIAEHHKRCPTFDPNWINLTGDAFVSQLMPIDETTSFPNLA